MIHRISSVYDELVLLLFYLVQLLLVEPQIERRYMKYETKMIFSVFFFFFVSSFVCFRVFRYKNLAKSNFDLV